VASLYVAGTTPGIIYKDMIIIGTRVAEEAAAAPGYIRAYDVHTGKLRWIFHTIPLPGESGYDTWDDKDAWEHIGGVNTWSGFSLDEKKGILFLEAKDWAMIFLPIVCWQLMHPQEKGSGIFKQYIMIYGIEIYPQRLCW
jgi:glucose dehydrogenase